MDGQLMSEYLKANEIVLVIGCDRSRQKNSNLDIYLELDIRDRAGTEEIIKLFRPDYFINFAGETSAQGSWNKTNLYAESNIAPVFTQLELLEKYAPNCRYFNAGSSQQFAGANYHIRPDFDFSPTNPYGASKCAAHMGVKLWRDKGFYATQGILFNHESVLRSEAFVSRKISKGVSRIKKALESGENFEPLKLNVLTSEVDWSHAEDVVEGIWKSLQISDPDDFVFASGEKRTVKNFVEEAFKVVDIEGFWELSEDLGEVFVSGMRIVAKEDCLFQQTLQKKQGPSANIYKTKDKLNWGAKKSFEDMVREMVMFDYQNL